MKPIIKCVIAILVVGGIVVIDHYGNNVSGGHLGGDGGGIGPRRHERRVTTRNDRQAYLSKIEERINTSTNPQGLLMAIVVKESDANPEAVFAAIMKHSRPDQLRQMLLAFFIKIGATSQLQDGISCLEKIRDEEMRLYFERVLWSNLDGVDIETVKNVLDHLDSDAVARCLEILSSDDHFSSEEVDRLCDMYQHVPKVAELSTSQEMNSQIKDQGVGVLVDGVESGVIRNLDDWRKYAPRVIVEYPEEMLDLLMKNRKMLEDKGVLAEHDFYQYLTDAIGTLVEKDPVFTASLIDRMEDRDVARILVFPVVVKWAEIDKAGLDRWVSELKDPEMLRRVEMAKHVSPQGDKKR